MKKEEIKFGDWERVLLGEAPLEFLVEVLIRTLIIYLALLVIIRLMGKRMGGQLTISELAVMVTLGAIVSPAMQIPQIGLLMGIMILVCALLFKRGINFLEYKNKKFEKMSQGKLSILVKNGTMELHEMEKTRVSRQQLFSALRNENIFNLGEVDRVYLEASGIFSIYQKKNPSPGLALFPPDDNAIDCYAQEVTFHSRACTHCGNVCSEDQAHQPCGVCGSGSWTRATCTDQQITLEQTQA
jgi:uncharacterized membrane protein YcaP (DUF421 family)